MSTDRHTDRQTDRPTDRQTDRQTDDMPKMSFLESACLKTWRFIKISKTIFWTNAILYQESKKKKKMKIMEDKCGVFIMLNSFNTF